MWLFCFLHSCYFALSALINSTGIPFLLFSSNDLVFGVLKCHLSFYSSIVLFVLFLLHLVVEYGIKEITELYNVRSFCKDSVLEHPLHLMDQSHLQIFISTMKKLNDSSPHHQFWYYTVSRYKVSDWKKLPFWSIFMSLLIVGRWKEREYKAKQRQYKSKKLSKHIFINKRVQLK